LSWIGEAAEPAATAAAGAAGLPYRPPTGMNAN
jgi:hypothetical protein